MKNRLKMWLREIAWRILRTVHPSEDEIDRALKGAFADCGVNVDDYDLAADIGGKRYEVLHHAAVRLGNPLRTIGDIKALLQ